MCGIAGQFDFKKNSSTELKASTIKMLERIKYRGPDTTSIEVFQNSALGINRLSLVDLDNSNSIFKLAENKIAFVVNGEIYNHNELRKELIHAGYTFRSRCDSEIIGPLYHMYGLDFLHKLNGQFAIAIFDFRFDKVILARDRFGIAPLFYNLQDGLLSFSSEVSSLLAIPNIDKQINPKSLDQIFTFWTTIGSHTFFKNISQVQPGHLVEITAMGLRDKKYYELNLHPDLVDNHLAFNQAKDLVRHQVTESIKIRMNHGDQPAGSYVSGGIDSSIVTSVMCNESSAKRVKTFSVDFEDSLYSEKKYQDQLLFSLPVDSSILKITNSDIVNNFSNMVRHSSQPVFRTAPVPLYLLSKAAQEKNVKVILSGEGADEIFWGYDTFKETKIRQFWKRFPDSTIRPQLFKKLFSQYPHFGENFNEFISSFYRKTLSSEDQDFYSHLPRWQNNMALKNIFSDQLKNELKHYNSFEDLRQQLPADFSKYSALSKCQYLEMKTLLPGYLLSSQGDRMAFAHGIELRPIFVDHHLVEMSHRLPGKYKLGPGLKDKFILREAFKHILPKDIFERPKQAYQAPEAIAFAQNMESVADLLTPETTKKYNLFDPHKVNILRNKLLSANAPRLSTRDNMATIQVLSTHILAQEFSK